MLDAAVIREDAEGVRRALEKRSVHVDLSEFLALDDEFRRSRIQSEQLRAERKKLSGEVARTQREGGAVEPLRDQAKRVGTELAELETRLAEVEAARQKFLDALPNLPDEDIVAGGKENNEVVRSVGEKPDFGFTAKDHVDLATGLGLIDYKRGAKLGGSGFWVYTGNGAMLEWSLLNYFVDEHRKDGYEFVLPPHILTYEAGYTAGQFPKFADEVFVIEQGEDGRPSKFLLPTSETALVNLHRDETLPEAELPRKYFAYSPCYRREIGSYRASERGSLRGHQFDKVEMFQFVRPEDSPAAHEELLGKAEALVAGLGLHYRISKLAAGDTSPAMARTYDVEVWLPSIDAYVEVSSVSNARDYQARRGNIRYRPAEGKSAHVHTLNASGLATSRLLPAILEQHQTSDGSVALPEVLHKWLGADVLKAASR